MKSESRIWLIALAYWLVGSVLIYFLSPLTTPDSTARYAPMADAFARGDWYFAFHPRFGVLFQCVAGSIAWITGMSGDHACQTASLLFLSLAAVPLWHLARELFGERVAWWTAAALLVCDDFTRYAFEGLRDVGKCLAFALLGLGAVGIVRKPDSLRPPLWFGLGLFCLVTLVTYGFAVASVLIALWCGYCFFSHDSRYPVIRASIPILLYVAATAIATVMVHAYTGHWLPAPHFIKILGGWL